jgi:hypothetical protein
MRTFYRIAAGGDTQERTGQAKACPTSALDTARFSVPVFLAVIQTIEYSNNYAGHAAGVQGQHLPGFVASHADRHSGSITRRRAFRADLSQHLAILRSRQIVKNRKDGNQVFYSVRNPVLLEVLDIMRRYFQTNLADAIKMLEEVDREGAAR